MEIVVIEEVGPRAQFATSRSRGGKGMGELACSALAFARGGCGKTQTGFDGGDVWEGNSWLRISTLDTMP